MIEDVYITWSPYEHKQLTFYSKQGAAATAANIGATISAIAFLIWYALRGRHIWIALRICFLAKILILIGLLSGPLIFFVLPKIEVTVTRMPRIQTMRLHQIICAELEWTAQEKQKTEKDFRPTLEWIRQKLLLNSSIWQSLKNYHQDQNPLTGQACLEEDSPGNYTFRETAKGIDYVWYDIEGHENITPLFR